jgi:hypothetical protein
MSVLIFELCSSAGKPPSPLKIPLKSPCGFSEKSPKGSPHHIPIYFPPPSPRNSPLRNMANQTRRPWIELREMVVVGQLHVFPKHPKNFIPKYDP